MCINCILAETLEHEINALVCKKVLEEEELE